MSVNAAGLGSAPQPVSGSTAGALVGFHSRVGSTSSQAKRAYRGSFGYSKFFGLQ